MEKKVDCFTRSFASLESSNQGGFYWKTSQPSLFEESEKYSEKWPRSAVVITRRTSKGWSTTVSQLPCLARRTDGIASSYWLTPTATQIPPTKERRKKRIAYRKSIGRKDVAGCLVEQVMTPKLWPTPTSRDYKDSGDWKKLAKYAHKKRLGCSVAESDKVSGGLNPTWIEWLMGFPEGWTELNASETQ